MTDHTPSPRSSAPDDGTRRSFFTKAAAFIVGTVVGVVPLAAGIAMLFDPLIKRRGSILGADRDGFLKVTSTSSLATDGTPRLFKVIADVQDAWNKFPHTEIGSVYIRKVSSDQVECFTARCPHLGCTVDYKADQNCYVCPCHDSSFELNGERKNDIPPRSMDSLDAEIRDGDVWVKFQKFRAGIHEKKPV